MRIPTAHSTNSLERFLRHMQTVPQPAITISREYLKSAGFESGNDPELRHIFRLIGFLGEEFYPTERWTKYQEKGQEVLAEALYVCYRELFELFPDAFSQSDSDLDKWFHPPLTGETRSSIERAKRTFRKLCQFAGITPDNRLKPMLDKRAGRLLGPSSNNNKPIFQIPALYDKTAYKVLLESIKEVFYE